MQNEKLKEFDLHIKRMDDFEKLIKFKMENKLPLGIGTELSFPNQKIKGKIERIKSDAYPNYQILVETFFINLENY